MLALCLIKHLRIHLSILLYISFFLRCIVLFHCARYSETKTLLQMTAMRSELDRCQSYIEQQRKHCESLENMQIEDSVTLKRFRFLVCVCGFGVLQSHQLIILCFLQSRSHNFRAQGKCS